jgi:thiol-disulfide isomerase/thioredoxin
MTLKKIFVCFLLVFGLSSTSSSQNFSQLAATDAVSGRLKTLSNLAKDKGVLLIFYDPSCPFANLYESRIKGLNSKFEAQGIAFALINPQAQNNKSEQSRLRSYIEESGLNIPYLIDGEQEWIKLFQLSKIPEVILLVPGKTGLEVVYKGAIDNNPQLESAVTEKYLEMALIQVTLGEKPAVPQVRAVGCNIRIY